MYFYEIEKDVKEPKGRGTNSPNNINDYDKLEDTGTGSHIIDYKYKIINYTFDKYQIKVKLTEENEFLGIVEVKVNKDFLTNRQKSEIGETLDIEKYYPEEEEEEEEEED